MGSKLIHSNCSEVFALKFNGMMLVFCDVGVKAFWFVQWVHCLPKFVKDRHASRQAFEKTMERYDLCVIQGQLSFRSIASTSHAVGSSTRCSGSPARSRNRLDNHHRSHLPVDEILACLCPSVGPCPFGSHFLWPAPLLLAHKVRCATASPGSARIVHAASWGAPEGSLTP